MRLLKKGSAHWAYKENNNITAAQEQREIQDKLSWYETLSTYEDEVSDAENLLEFVKEDIFNANVYVFTPKGDVLDFPPNSTPIDFAYRVHTELGHRTTGAIVNGRIVPLSYHLNMGDVVEIKSNRNSFGPSEEWLNFVGTSQARSKIRQFFNRARRQDNIARGEELFLTELRAMGKAHGHVDLKELASMNKKISISSWDDLYHDLGRGQVLAKTILSRYFEKNRAIDEGQLVAEINERPKSVKVKNRYGIIVEGLVNVEIKISKCCHPIPGDAITGFITKTTGIAVHHSDCPNLRDKSRFVDVWFTDDIKTLFVAKIRVKALARQNILSDIITKISGININIESLNTSTLRETAVIDLELSVTHLDVLNRSATGLRSVKDVFSVERVIG